MPLLLSAAADPSLDPDLAVDIVWLVYDHLDRAGSYRLTLDLLQLRRPSTEAATFRRQAALAGARVRLNQLDAAEADGLTATRSPARVRAWSSVGSARAIPYPVFLVLVDGDHYSASVAHKRLSKAEVGRIVATDFLRTPWIGAPPCELDEAFTAAMAFKALSHVDFYGMYRGMVNAVLARNCATLSGHFTLDATTTEDDRRQRLARCTELAREISRNKTALRVANGFAEKLDLNTRIKELEARLATAKASL